MRAFRIATLLLAVLALTVGTMPAVAGEERDLGREVLLQNDGWASEGPGVTGGSAATDEVYTVTNRKELIAALNDGVYPPPSTTPSNTPKIIYISGVIDANVDDNNQPLTCADYQRDGFTWDAFLAAYDPAVWGKVLPSGGLENARVASREAQKERVRIRIGSNTTIVGLGNNAAVHGAWFDIAGSRDKTTNLQTPKTNIIIRNLLFEDTYDCFPAWTPTDGSAGNWNAEYDAISLRESDHVWVDHNTFRDRATSDSLAPVIFGRHFEQHDGLLDITNASNLVTVSWNRFLNHDKVMLIGSSDNPKPNNDRTRLKVTLHHNLFDGTGQRVPRVRFGQVHIYNNYYKVINNPGYIYAWGVGVESEIYAQNNAVTTDQKLDPAGLIGLYKGTMIFETGTRINGTEGGGFVDVVGAYNALYDPDLLNVTWKPTLFTTIDPTMRVIPLVESGSGPFNW